MSDFKVGEILIFQNGEHEPFRNESECELIGGWEIRQVGIMDHVAKKATNKDLACYQVIFADGAVRNVQQYNLRRKKPKQDDINTVVSWDTCLWNPHKITETI